MNVAVNFTVIHVGEASDVMTHISGYVMAQIVTNGRVSQCAKLQYEGDVKNVHKCKLLL